MIKKLFFIYMICLFNTVVLAQDTRLQEIREQLEYLAENELPGLNEKVSFDLSGASLQEVLRSLAKSHELNINIGNIPSITVSNSFNGVEAKDLIYFLCREYNLEVAFINTIMSFSKVLPVVPVKKEKKINLSMNGDLITANLKNDSIYNFSRQFAELTNVNITIGPGLSGTQLNGFIKELPVDKTLEQIAFANGLELTKINNNIYTFNKQADAVVPANTTATNSQGNRGRNYSNNNNSRQIRRRTGSTGTYQLTVIDQDARRIKLDADGTDISGLIVAISDKLGIDYVMLAPPEGYFDGFLGDISYGEFLQLVLPTANSGYSVKNNVYLIGAKNNDDTMVSDIYKLQNRSVDSLLVLIPKNIQQSVILQPYNGLNALIISGDDISVKRAIEFLKKVDEPIPNILIEIIVADLRKGHTISTGITAGLSDSSIATGGTVFPGVDLTLSSNSVNKFLNNIDSKGIINLGRVTPQFYATVKALEDNNLMDTRSTPKLSTLNGQEANLIIGEKVFYLVENQNIAPGVNPIISNLRQFEEAEANLQIKIVPFVSGNEDITLTIDAEFSDFIDASVPGGPPGTATRQFQSKIRVRNEEMIVLGGLEENTSAESATGVPVLSRIPVLKWLFSGRTKSKAESRLVVFIKPTVIY
ncbi:MAG: type II and III secretion system protein [Cyclobacteriaceae bacterium]